MFARFPGVGLFAAPLFVVACSGSNLASQIAKPPVFEPKGQTKCGVTKSQAKPLIVEWPSSDRSALESMVKTGVVVVRYEGCEIEVLDRCRAPGGYRYSATTRQVDRVTIKDADDLYASVPMGAAKLEGKLATAGQLNVAMTIVGRYEAEKASAEAAVLVGTDCARATHIVTAVTLGAFAFFAGADATVGTGVTAAGVGAGANSASNREMITAAGDENACKNATSHDAKPPEGCGAFLRVEVVPIDASAPPVAPEPPSAQAVLPPSQRTSAASHPPQPPPHREELSRSWVLPGFAIGAALAGFGAMGVSTGVLVGAKGTLARECDGNDRCTPAGMDAARSVGTLSAVGTVGFIVGAVGAAGFVTWLVWPPSKPAAKTARVTPIVAPSYAGFELGRAF